METEKLRIIRKFASENGCQRRLDEEFLNRFLVGHELNVTKAATALLNYESFVNRRSNTWLKLKKSRIELILESQVIDVLNGTGISNQKIVWIRIENWNVALFTADEMLEVSGLLCELVYAKRETITSIDVIIDLHNFSLKHLYALTPKFAKRMIFFMSQCLPMQLFNIYIVRQPRIFYLLYAIFKPFIEERMRKMIYICGYNFKPLVDNIGADLLPVELDGLSDTLPSQRWLNFLNNRRIMKELRLFGYEFLDDTLIQEPSYFI